MIRRIGLGSLAAIAIALLASAMAAPAPQDPWADEKKDPKFADVDWGYTKDPPFPFVMGRAPAGAPLYEKYCMQCHGATGKGDGDLAPMLIPPPRDFTKGIFKGRSSHPEMPPTSTDLMRSLVHGIPLSGMLSYSFINTDAQLGLIGHVTTLADGHFTKGYGYPLKTGNFHRDAGMPFPTVETLARGKALFERLNCVACHGEKGDGKGSSTPSLSDTQVVHDGESYDRPSFVRDLTQGIYSGGPNVRHMYLRVSGGVQGTVMPPFATSASPEDRWAVTHYVMSLSKRAKDLPLPHSEVLIVKKEAKLPAGPKDPAWAALEKLPRPAEEGGPLMYKVHPFWVLPIYLQQTRHNPARPYFTEANVRAIHDGKQIAFRIEWEDAASHADDRIELQLGKNADPNPMAFLPPGFVLYGDAADPVNLWRWESKAPAAAVELDGKGPFAVVPQGASDVTAAAAYDAASKRWVVVFTRSLAGDGKSDHLIGADTLSPFSILMRDGGEAWPEGTRAIAWDPEDTEGEIKAAKAKEDKRKAMEKAVEAKFKDLPRHLTTWHLLRLE